MPEQRRTDDARADVGRGTTEPGGPIDIKLPADCGNSPRLNIVGDFAASWAIGDEAAIARWLADDVVWTLVRDGTYSGSSAASKTKPPFKPKRVEITAVITHGRLASCDGYLEAGSKRVDFSHVFRFASTSKTAKIVELRSYCIG